AFAGLSKIFSTNVTSYIESGAIGSAQINQAYIRTLFGHNATFSGRIFANKIEGDLVDGDEIPIPSFSRESVQRNWIKISSFYVAKNSLYQTTIVALLGEARGLRRASAGGQTSEGDYSPLLFSLGGASSIGTPRSSATIPQGTGKVHLHIWADLRGNKGYDGVDVNIPAQRIPALQYRKGSGNFIS
ncbi:MAG: hypothetical protein HRU25_16645, partial [Psychrobium sp.]|nr:hypothetical protein [Psychrobium sp.]